LVGVGTFGIPNITESTLNRKDQKYILVTTRLHHTPDVQVWRNQIFSLSRIIYEFSDAYFVCFLYEGTIGKSVQSCEWSDQSWRCWIQSDHVVRRKGWYLFVSKVLIIFNH
jgi:hypothetical protein